MLEIYLHIVQAYAWNIDKVLGRKHPERHCRDPQLGAPVQDIVELVGATLVDLTLVAQASPASMGAGFCQLAFSQ